MLKAALSDSATQGRSSALSNAASAARHEVGAALLWQQREALASVQAQQLEALALPELWRDLERVRRGDPGGAVAGADDGNKGGEAARQAREHEALAKEAVEGLNLNSEQEAALREARSKSDEDMLELAILAKCTEALRARLAGGLQLPTLEGVTEAWRTMLTAPQLVKYGKVSLKGHHCPTPRCCRCGREHAVEPPPHTHT